MTTQTRHELAAVYVSFIITSYHRDIHGPNGAEGLHTGVILYTYVCVANSRVVGVQACNLLTAECPRPPRLIENADTIQ